VKVAAALLLLAGCGAPVRERPAEKRPPVALAARVPQRSELVCFPCHSQVKFEHGPPFAHALAGHRGAGHCHVCHLGKGHEGREIDVDACVSCHGQRGEELGRLATSDKKSK
jgi:hypothetical protein